MIMETTHPRVSLNIAKPSQEALCFIRNRVRVVEACCKTLKGCARHSIDSKVIIIRDRAFF